MWLNCILGFSPCNSNNFCFQIHFVKFYCSRREFQWMAAIILQAIRSSYAKYQKKISIFAKAYEKKIVSKDYCTTHHDDETCFLPAWKNHLILLGEIEELVHKLDTFCSIYQHVDCLYTLFKYRFSKKIIAKSGIVFDNMQRATSFNQRNRGKDKMRSVAKERLFKKVSTSFSWVLSKRTNQPQTSGSVFSERVENAKKTKFELELMKIVECFHDGLGNYDSNLASFRLKPL